ncbi:hypothetical protein AAH678_29575 [Sodalis endosymbiont of Spalangia cameroni]|uniref:hypothetical protein n=1 Tax=Sodalis praecaptivus TaxID=1239307 RepID=UPI0031F8D6F5
MYYPVSRVKAERDARLLNGGHTHGKNILITGPTGRLRQSVRWRRRAARERPILAYGRLHQQQATGRLQQPEILGRSFDDLDVIGHTVPAGKQRRPVWANQHV